MNHQIPIKTAAEIEAMRVAGQQAGEVPLAEHLGQLLLRKALGGSLQTAAEPVPARQDEAALRLSGEGAAPVGP